MVNKIFCDYCGLEIKEQEAIENRQYNTYGSFSDACIKCHLKIKKINSKYKTLFESLQEKKKMEMVGVLEMKIIYKNRNSGKTEELLELANNSEGYNLIVCHSHNTVRDVWRRILELKYNLPQPITFDQFIRNEYCGMNVANIFIDNIDCCLQMISRANIGGITLTNEKRQT